MLWQYISGCPTASGRPIPWKFGSSFASRLSSSVDTLIDLTCFTDLAKSAKCLSSKRSRLNFDSLHFLISAEFKRLKSSLSFRNFYKFWSRPPNSDSGRWTPCPQMNSRWTTACFMTVLKESCHLFCGRVLKLSQFYESFERWPPG